MDAFERLKNLPWALDHFGQRLQQQSEARSVLIALLFCFALYPMAFLTLQVITPAHLLYAHPPWKNHNPHGIEPKSYILSDQMDALMPPIIYMRHKMLDGILPLYTDRIQNGVPFFGVIRNETGVLPLIVLTLLFGVGLGWNVYIIGRTLLGFYFFSKLMRLYGLSKTTAITAAVVFSFSSYAIQNHGMGMHLQYVLVPAILYGIERIIRDRSVPWFLVLPFLGNFLVVSGYPPGTAYCATLIIAYTVFRIATAPADRLKLLGILGATAVLCALISLPALAATREFFYQDFNWDYRSGYWSQSLPRASLPTYLYPFINGSRESVGGAISWMRHATYLGALPFLMLIPSYFFGRFTALKIFFTGFAVWLLLVLYDIGGFLAAVYRHIPILNGAMPNNQIQVLLIVLSVLFALALEDLLWHRCRPWRRHLALLALAGTLAVMGYWAYLYFPPGSHALKATKHLWRHAPVVLTSSALIVATLLGRLSTHRAAVLTLVLVSVDLFMMGVGWNRTTPRGGFYTETPGIRYIKEHLGHHKVFMLETALLANAPLAYDIPTISGRGFYSEQQRNMYRLIDEGAFSTHATQYIFRATTATHLDTQTTDALGIKLVVAPEGTKLDDLARDYFIRQKEWNTAYALKPGQVVAQTFRAERDFSPDVLELRIDTSHVSQPATLSARVIGPDGQRDFPVPLAPTDGSALTIALEEVVFSKDADYQLQFRFAGKDGDFVSFFAAQGVDLIRTGTAMVDGSPVDGDLSLHLFNTDNQLAHRLHDKFELVYDDDITIWENRHVFGRAFLVAGVHTVNEEVALTEMRNPDADLSRQAWITSPDDRPHSLEAYNDSPLEGAVQTVRLSEVFQRHQARASRPALLVVGDNYHRGWRATVDGQDVPLLRVNYNLRGIAVPAGTSTIELTYAPPRVIAALRISLATVLGMVLFAALRALRHLAQHHSSTLRPAAPPRSLVRSSTRG